MMGSASSSSTSSSDSDDDSSSFDASDGEGQKVSSSKQDTDGGEKNDLDLSQLFHHTSLREAASKIKDDTPETVLQQHHSHILRWLEERKSRHEETVSLSQFCDLLMTRGVGRDECVDAFDQFDVDGEGCAEVTAMSETLKSSNGANLRGELAHVIRTLQTCCLTPGLVDVYSTDRESIGHHGKRLVKYILRNRAPSTGLPFYYLDSFSNITTMRLLVLEKYLAQKHKETALKVLIEEEGGNIKVVNKCYKWIRVSTSHNLAQWLEDNEASTYWQSNGHARSHWIRMRLKEDICLQHLSIKVAQSDQSYMPQHVVVLTGRSPNSLHTIREVSIPNNVNGDVTLLENAHVTSPYIQINITRCHSDGCDVRIHGIKTVGYRSVPNSEVSVKDASIVWYFSVVASTSTITMATNPLLKQLILQHTRTALSHMPPLSLTNNQMGKSSFPSPYVLDQAEEFLYTVAKNPDGDLDMEGIKILLELALTRGSVVRVVKALQHVLDSKEDKVVAVKLLKSLSYVSEKLMRKYATQFPVSIAGCDGGQKESSSGPGNVLSSSWTCDAYLSEKTKVNMFFVSETPVYVTKLQIKVSKGGIGPAAGFVFVYDDKEEFELQHHIAKFEMYDTWTPSEYRILHGLRSVSIAGKPDNPVAYFTLNNDWDEADVQLDELTLGRYILIKFLRPRDTVNAERLGILGVRFFGHATSSSVVDNTIKSLVSPLPFAQDVAVTSAELCIKVLHFVVKMTKSQDLMKKAEGVSIKMVGLDMQSISLELLAKFYHSIQSTDPQWTLVRMLTLKLLHHSFPYIMSKLDSDTAKLKVKKVITQALPAEEGAVVMEQKEIVKPDWLVQWEECSQRMFSHLCELVNQDTPEEGPEMLLKEAAREAILDGAAVFFPDKDKRKTELFRLMDLLSSNVQPATNLVFQSLCHHFGSIDPSGLLNLPSSPTDENFDAQTILGVVRTLQSVVFKEFETSLRDISQIPKGQSYVSKLLGALQASLMAWCKVLLQSKTPNPTHFKLAHNAILKYTGMQCAKCVSALTCLRGHLTKQQNELKQIENRLKVGGVMTPQGQVRGQEEPSQRDEAEEHEEVKKEQLGEDGNIVRGQQQEQDHQQLLGENVTEDDRTKEQQQEVQIAGDDAMIIDEIQLELVKQQDQSEASGADASKEQQQLQQQQQESMQTSVDGAVKMDKSHQEAQAKREQPVKPGKEVVDEQQQESMQTNVDGAMKQDEIRPDKVVIQQQQPEASARGSVDGQQQQQQQQASKDDNIDPEKKLGMKEEHQVPVEHQQERIEQQHLQQRLTELKQQQQKLIDALQHSFVGATMRQLVLMLILLSEHCLPQPILDDIIQVSVAVKQLQDLLGQDFNEPPADDTKNSNNKKENEKVTLRKWDVESSHKYAHNQHVTQIFNCPGAQIFQVDFDQRCETELRYDYLEFTDSSGNKTRYDQKVGNDKWPLTHTFKSPHRLQFLFHSDSSNNEWGYKFTVTAKGSRDIQISWLYDLQLSLAKLQGKICSSILNPPKPKSEENATTTPDLEQSLKTAAANLLKGELWTTLFRGGHEVARLTRSFSGIHRTEPIESVINSFLVGVADGAPGAPSGFISRCQALYHMPSVGGELVNSAITSVFAALLWHSQELRDTVPTYVEADSLSKPSDGIIQAFRTAEGLRPLLIDLRQKQLAAQEKDPKTTSSDTDPIVVCREKARFLLQFAGLTKLEKKVERGCSELYTRSKSLESRGMKERQSSLEMNAAFQGTAEEGTVLSKYPEFKLVLDFVKNPHLTVERVRGLLDERQERARAVANTFQFACQFLKDNGKPSMFQPDCLQFLKEMLLTKRIGDMHYASRLDGCGLELEARLRGSFYLLVQCLVEAIENFDCTDQQEEVQTGYACMQACLLHLLDVDWQLYDLQFLCNIKAPSLLLSISKRNVSIRDKLISESDEAKQLEVHKQCMAWFKEFRESSARFSEWFENIRYQDTLEKRRARHMFVARYCSLLDVKIKCDGCDTSIPGARYRCLECTDIDLCYRCYFGGAQTEGHLDDHPMVNFRYNCDSCNGFIVGTRIHCNVCDDFDLCYGCNYTQDLPEGHTAAHNTEIFPMTTENQLSGLLETYSHHHSWLLFSSLALSLADMMHNTQSRGVNSEYTRTASKLFQQCIELVAQCLPSIAQPSTSEIKTDDKETGKDNEGKTTEITMTTESKVTESEKEIKERLREKTFMSSSQERVLGLLGAMLLENTRHDGSPLRQLNTQELHIGTILPLLLKLSKEPNIRDNNTQHQIVALLGQLLIHIPPKDADEVVQRSKNLPPEPHTLLLIQGTEESSGTASQRVGDDSSSEMEKKETDKKEKEGGSGYEVMAGALTVDFLFDLGASCLEKNGLEWTSLMAGILQRLCIMPSWQAVIARKISNNIQYLPQQCPLPCIFTLFVVAGFPEVLCLGNTVRYSEPLVEQSSVIVIKHLVEKNRAIVADVRTRKRKQVKDYKLIVDEDFGQSLKPDQFLFFITIAKDVLAQLKEGAKLNAEMVWVLYLIMKAILANIKRRPGPHFVSRLGSNGTEGRLQLLDSNLIPLLVHLASQATRLNRQWILRDLEILSIRLYTHDKSGSTTVSSGPDLDPASIDSDHLSTHEDGDDDIDDKDSSDNENDNDDSNDDDSSSDFHSTSTLSDTSGSGYATPDYTPPLPGRISESSNSSQGGLDPLEGLEDKTKNFMHLTNEALQTPLSILRAIYEKSGHSLEDVEVKIQEWFLEDDAPGVSSDIKEFAKRWEPRNTADKPSRMDLKSVDSGVISFSAASSLPKPTVTPDEAEPEPCIDGSLKLIASSEKSLRESYQQQQRSRSAGLLKKELNSLGKNLSKEHLHKVNYAISIMYARHLLAALLADWPSGRVISTSTLGCTESAQMVSVLDLLQRGEEKEVLHKVVCNVVSHCQPELLAPLTVAACTFMEEASMAPITRESLHKYKNNTNDEGHVTIRGATYLSIKFDERCSTESECDVLTIAADSNFKQDKHEFSGGRENWTDFEIPGDMLHFKFVSDSSNNDWGYKFTVIGNRLGRFDTGYIILNTVLSKKELARHIALQELWAWLVYVACRQTAQYRLKTVQILLQVLHTLTSANLVSESATIDTATAPDLGLLKPLLRLLDSMNARLVPDASSTTLPPLQRALTELFMRAENLALDWGIHDEYALAMMDEKIILNAVVQGVRNVAALGIAIGLPNKATKECQKLQATPKISSI